MVTIVGRFSTRDAERCHMTERVSGAPRAGGGIVFGCIVVSIAIIAAFGWFVAVAVRTHAFGLFSCVREPYYTALVARISRDAAFVRELGTPIRVSDADVSCTTIDDSGDSRKATCDLPVSGPRGSGYVHAVIDDEDGDLSARLGLHIGDRIVHAGS